MGSWSPVSNWEAASLSHYGQSTWATLARNARALRSERWQVVGQSETGTIVQLTRAYQALHQLPVRLGGLVSQVRVRVYLRQSQAGLNVAAQAVPAVQIYVVTTDFVGAGVSTSAVTSVQGGFVSEEDDGPVLGARWYGSGVRGAQSDAAMAMDPGSQTVDIDHALAGGPPISREQIVTVHARIDPTGPYGLGGTWVDGVAIMEVINAGG